MKRLEALKRAEEEFDRRLRAFQPDDWSKPTGCGPWTVRELVNHVMAGNHMAVMLLAGSGADGARAALERDLIGDDDPLAAWDQWSGEQMHAFRESGAMDRICQHPAGELQGRQLLERRVAEYVIHAWDVARATGGDEELDPELVEEVWVTMSARADGLAASGGYGSGPSGKVPEDAPLQQRLLDLTGRRP